MYGSIFYGSDVTIHQGDTLVEFMLSINETSENMDYVLSKFEKNIDKP